MNDRQCYNIGLQPRSLSLAGCSFVNAEPQNFGSDNRSAGRGGSGPLLFPARASLFRRNVTRFPSDSTEKATDGSLQSEDWTLNMEICDIINETEEGYVCSRHPGTLVRPGCPSRLSGLKGVGVLLCFQSVCLAFKMLTLFFSF